jgi:ribonucleoside-diphosphate reductase beta chain
MEISQIIKRDYSTSPFVLEKITDAVEKAMQSVGNGSRKDAEIISMRVYETLLGRKELDPQYTPTVEQVQDIVEDTLMGSTFHDVAKAYILYRNEQARKRETDIFEKRIELKPYEYPQLNEYVDAIRHSYWIHTEFNFTSDIQDFRTRLTEPERNAIKNTMLAISQIEVAVKTFWGDIYHRMPKPEIGAVGATFAES